MSWLLDSAPGNLSLLLLMTLCTAVIAVVIVLSRWAITRLDPSESLPPPTIPAEPNPYEIAYMRGDKGAIIRLMVFNLYQRGFLEARKPSETGIGSWRLARKQGVTPDRAPRLEGSLLDCFTKPLEVSYIPVIKLPPVVADLCDDLSLRMRDEKFLVNPKAKRNAENIQMAAFGAITVSLSLLFAEMAQSGHFWLLYPFIIAGLCAVVFITRYRPGRLSARGKIYLNELRQAYEDRRSALAEEVDPSLALLMIALFGFGVLSDTPFAVMAEIFPPPPAGAAGGTSGSGGYGYGGYGGDFGSDGSGFGGDGGGGGGGGDGG
jgi:uncharacterized protein (TIGR04222 family)